jgi:tRNA A-37 threonylcarbamoyl transferase component Bud32
MSLARSLCAFALEQLVDGACNAAGFAASERSVEKVAVFLKRHFTDHSAKLDQALRTANERAWKALELALDGNSFWAKCNALLAQADQRVFAHQVRTFLEGCSLAELQGQRDEVRQACLRELRAAQKAGLFEMGRTTAGGLAEEVSGFARFADPQQRASEGLRTLAGMAAELKDQGYAYLSWLIGTQPTPGTSLLVVAVRFFFRREVESDRELWQGLAWATWQQMSEAQERGFACLGAALVQNSKRIEELLAGTHRVALDILAEVQGQREQIAGVARMVQDLLAQHSLDNRELRPQDSFSIRAPAERTRIEQLMSWYRRLPKDQQARLPALLNGLGKLQHAAGDFSAAGATFVEVAAVSADGEAQAEAHHNAYLAALERQDWPTALVELDRAAELNPARFQPFQRDKYELRQILGAGGFGVAFLCRHRISGGLRVLKALRVDNLTPETAQRIVQEAKAMEDLRHEAIITLYDCDYADIGRTRLYLAMEYFDGVTLAEYVRQHGPLSQREMLELARLIAEGLQAAHQRGILHRDIKPGNILVRKDGDAWKAKIIDFGLALQESVQEAGVGTVSVMSRATTLHEVAGTIDYAAPEQIGRLPGVPVDRRADIYGFGRTCCFALFQSPIPTGRQWRALPRGLAHWLDSCLEERPEQRPADFARVLETMGDVRLRKASGKSEPALAPALIVTRGQQVNAEYVLQDGRNVLGREGADIDLEDQEPPERCYISREHCAVHLSRGKLTLEDLGSANGTYLNRARVAVGERQPLKADDLIQIGPVVLKVRA